jgi:hypothetical protein
MDYLMRNWTVFHEFFTIVSSLNDLDSLIVVLGLVHVVITSGVGLFAMC